MSNSKANAFSPDYGKDWPAVTSLVNSMTGVSLLAMPYCFHKCGLILGAAILLGCAQLTYVSCCVLIRSGHITRSSSLEQLGLRCYDRIGKVVVESSVVGVQLASMIVNLVAVAELAPLLLAAAIPSSAHAHGSHPAVRYIATACLALGLALPLSLRRSLEGTAPISALAVFFYIAVVLHVATLGAVWLGSGTSVLSDVPWWRMEHLPECAPIFALCYSCQSQIFLLYNTLEEPSFERMKGVLRTGIGICVAEYLTVGLFGCMAFGLQEVSGNLLVALPSSALGLFVQLGFMTSALLSFPLMVVPCRESLESLCSPTSDSASIEPADSLPDVQKPMSSRRLQLWTAFIVGVSLLTAVSFPNVQSALSVVGATLGCTMSFVLPPLLFMKATARSGAKYLDQLGARVVLFCGVVLLVVGTGHLLVAAATTPAAAAANASSGEAVDESSGE